MGPGPRHGAALARKVPLAVLHEEVEGEEEEREGEESEEAVVEEAVRDAVLQGGSSVKLGEFDTDLQGDPTSDLGWVVGLTLI